VRGASDRHDAEPVPVGEGERRVARLELAPQPPDAELRLADMRVVEQYDAALAELRQPGLDVVRHRVVAMSAVDMEQVDRPVGKGGCRRVERLLEQGREGSVPRVVMLAEPLERLRAVGPGVLVSLPGVDRVAARRKLERLDGLAERAVRVALPGP